MDAELTAPPSPVTLIEGHSSTDETVLWVRMHDRHLQTGTIADNNGEKIFYIQGPGDYRSLTFRRGLRDPLGNHVFDLRRYAADLKMRWFVEDSEGNKIAELAHKKFWTSQHTAIDATILSTGTAVEMRPRDAVGSTNYISIGNSTIAEMTLHTNNTPKLIVHDRDMSVLRVRVAKGVDMSLVSWTRICRG